MNRSQRIVLIAYCLLVVYCCVWVPWATIMPLTQPIKQELGYDWVWSLGPSNVGEPDVVSIVLRLVAATALCAAAFLLGGKWKVTND